MVRKRISEMDEGEQRESEGERESESDLPQPDDSGRSQAMTKEEFDGLNDLFALLESHGYETVGGYSTTYVAEDDRYVVSLNATLPNDG